MDANDVIADGRVARVRELKTEVARLKSELAAAQNSLAAWERHFDWAVLAARDADRLPQGGRIVIVDGWNVQLGARGPNGTPRARRERVLDSARRHLAANPLDFVWVVFDGPRENAEEPEAGRLRTYFTGGEGAQRADRAICDYLHMLVLAGRHARALVVTDDKRLRRSVEALGFECFAAESF